MLRNIEHCDEKNVLYEMALSNATLGNVSYRVSRCKLLGYSFFFLNLNINVFD